MSKRALEASSSCSDTSWTCTDGSSDQRRVKGCRALAHSLSLVEPFPVLAHELYQQQQHQGASPPQHLMPVPHRLHSAGSGIGSSGGSGWGSGWGATPGGAASSAAAAVAAAAAAAAAASSSSLDAGASGGSGLTRCSSAPELLQLLAAQQHGQQQQQQPQQGRACGAVLSAQTHWLAM